MNASEINSPDTNVTESSSGFQRYIPRFSYSSDTGVLSFETEGTKQPDSELAPKKLAGINAKAVRSTRKKSETCSAAFKEYWVRDLPAIPEKVDTFRAHAEKGEALINSHITQKNDFRLMNKTQKETMKRNFIEFLKNQNVSPVLNNGGLLILDSINASTNLLNTWYVLIFASAIGGYPSVWVPTEVMDAYKSDDLFRVANEPNVLVISLSGTDVDGSSAQRRTHFLNNLSSVISARKNKPTVILREINGFYPNSSTFETIKKTFPFARVIK